MPETPDQAGDDCCLELSSLVGKGGEEVAAPAVFLSQDGGGHGERHCREGDGKFPTEQGGEGVRVEFSQAGYDRDHGDKPQPEDRIEDGKNPRPEPGGAGEEFRLFFNGVFSKEKEDQGDQRRDVHVIAEIIFGQ